STILCRAWAVTPRLTLAIPQTSAAHIGHIGQHQLGVALLQRRRAAVQPLLLLRLADQPVALVAPVALHLAAGGDAKALFRTALGFELGHFPSLVRRLRRQGMPDGAPNLI